MDGDMTALLRQVMENPQFGAMVQAMKTQMGGEDGGIDPAKIMDKMPDLMAALGPMMGAAQKEASAGERAEDTAETKEEEPAGKAPSSKIPEGAANLGTVFFRPDSRDKRNKLLAALKPYLSPARCALVDRTMSAMQMGELLGTVVPPKQDE